MLHGRMLRYLDEVVRSGSIRKAAIRLNVAASAINRQILQVEEELETPIFERMPGGLRLTAAGEILIAHVRQTLREHERALGRMAELRGLTRGEVTLATMGGLAASVLAEAVSRFREVHARVKLTVRVLPRETIVQAVLTGEADLGLGYNLPAHPRLYAAMDFNHPIGVVVAPGHPLAGRISVRFTDCLPYPLVTADRSMSLRDAVELLVPANVDFAPAVETNSLGLMKRLARISPHATFLSFIEVHEELRSGELAFLPFSGANAQQNIRLVHRAMGALDPVVSVVAQHIMAAFASRNADA